VAFPTSCDKRESILDDELTAWSLYWEAITKRTPPHEEIDRLKRTAQCATTAVKNHKEHCVACRNMKLGLDQAQEEATYEDCRYGQGFTPD